VSSRPGSRRPFRPIERQLEPPATDAVFESGLYLPLDQIELAEAGGAPLVVNGNLAVSWVDSTFSGTVADDQLEQAGAGVPLRGAATVELAMDAGAEVAGSLRLALIPLPSLPVPPSIEVFPFVDVSLDVAASADADARISVVAPFRLGAGFAFDGSLRAGLSSPVVHEPEVGLPDGTVALSASVGLNLTLVLLLTIQEVPVGGPVIGASLSTLVGVDPATGASVDTAVEIVGGWAFPGLDGLPDIPEELSSLLPLQRVDLAPGGRLLDAGGAPTRWSRLFGIDEDDGAAAVLPADAGVVVVEDRTTPWLAALDGAGVPLWQSTAADAWFPNGMASAVDADLILAGVFGSTMRVDRFSPAGEPRWTRRLSVPDADQTTCVAVVSRSSGGAVLAGEVNRSGVFTALLAAIDDSGGVEWSIEVDAGAGSTRPGIAALAEAPSGDIIAVGQVDYTEVADASLPPIQGENALILKVGPDGAVRSAFALGGAGTERGSRVVVAPDGSYLVGGHLGRAPNVWLASLRADDSLRWSASYRARPQVNVAELTGLAAVTDGHLACGHLESSGADAWLLRVDAEGMPVWVKTTVGADSDDEPSAVVALDDGLVACGRTQVREDTVSNGDLWVVRANVDGMLHFLADTGLDCECATAEWQRIDDHSIRTLAPSAVAVTLDLDTAQELRTNPAAVFGELLTD
jgi:hypothetical protein